MYMQATATFRTRIDENSSGEEYRTAVREAVESLTPAQLLRLRTFAKWRSKIVGKKAAGRDWEDLLSEAITSVLEGRRAWDQTRGDFYSFLVGAMRSISASWYAQRAVEFSEADWPSQVYLDEVSPTMLDLFASTRTDSDPELVVVADDLLRKCEEALKDDSLALQTFHLLSLGMNGKEITAALEIPLRTYEATTKRLRRRLRRALVPEDIQAGDNGKAVSGE
jgi:DNA-directed RNA polymerase specialized sigma24 family protein